MLVLSDFDQSYSLYDIILVIYLILYFCRPFSLIMEVFPPLSNTWRYCTKNRLEIYRFLKGHLAAEFGSF